MTTSIAAWVFDYNNHRPHSALGYRTVTEATNQLRTTSTGRWAETGELSAARPVAACQTVSKFGWMKVPSQVISAIAGILLLQ